MKKSVETYPKVSIVIPVYNGERYVRFAINSALAQTYKNLEIIVVNDGSTDKTDEIVKSYGNKIRYIKKENGGVSSALNLAIRKMKGDYFSWLSHDDTYEPNKIEEEIDYLIKNNLIGKKVIVFSDYYLINTKGKIIANCRKDHDEIVNKPEFILMKGHVNGLSLLIPKSAFDEYGEFDTKLICVQDYVKWYEMSKTYRFVHIPKCLVSTRFHPKQVTNTNPKVLSEGNAFYRRLIDETSRKRKEELEGSEYCFYRVLEAFYKNSVYDEMTRYCKEQADKILKGAEDCIDDKKVSVVIPFCNRCEETLRAIDSILKQSFKHFEIVLINDGSSEDISEIRELATEHNNIRLFENKSNMGVSASRNLGIKKAKGEYIAFLDSDDVFEPDKLKKQIQYMVASKAVMSHTSYTRNIDGDKVIIHSGKDEGHCERKMMYNCPIATPTVMLRTNYLIENNLFFDENIAIGEDTCFWLELLKRNNYLIGIDEPLTTVNVGRNAAAYSDEKQVIGLKAIIRYLLNDEYYSKYDYELSLLMKAYAMYLDRIKEEEDPLIKGGAVHKLFFFMKTEGIRLTSKRILKKTVSVVKRK